MCGIFAIFNVPGGDAKQFRARALALSKRIRHRGPDWSGMKIIKNHIICHERLAIIGVDSGAQPLVSEDENFVLSVNGEIYNYLSLQKSLQKKRSFKTESDCEVILYLYEERGLDFLNDLDGLFAFVLYDSQKNSILVARDPIGITTLYAGFNTSTKALMFASEMKCLNEECDTIIAFPPGKFMYLNLDSVDWKSFGFRDEFFKRYYEPAWFDENRIPSITEHPEPDYKAIRQALEAAVHKRLMAEVPFGVLLSGGLDSSLIAAIAARAVEQYSKRHQLGVKAEDLDEPYDEALDQMKSLQWFQKLHSFSIGLRDAPDLKAAVEVAKFLGTVHHEYIFTLQEGLDALSDVVYHLETYDVTTIRASTPMYLMSRKIRSIGVKMVLSGEGSDEIFGGYLYFFNAPNADEFHKETVRRVKNLHLSDCLRANKSTMAWGLEARVPFLDKNFLRVAMECVPPQFKMPLLEPRRIEKDILRRAFDKPDHPYLPDNILWRQKEQFSDGVGYSWIDELKRWTEENISDSTFATAAQRFPVDTPTTKEAFHYRCIFEQHFPQSVCVPTVMRWIPRRDWGCAEDPSGRAQKAHEKNYGNDKESRFFKRKHEDAAEASQIQ